MKFKNIWLHFKKICIHKRWVFHYCKLAGIPWRGIKHDMSKFSFIEFWESVKYYQGNSSPIDACKRKNGWSKAWQHHKGRNSHHYEYWVDDLDHGGKPLIMPLKDSIEMLCDYLGAGRAYSNKNFTYKNELDWWENKIKNPLLIHPVQRYFISTVLLQLTINRNEKNILNYDYLKYVYNKGISKYGKNLL